MLTAFTVVAVIVLIIALATWVVAALEQRNKAQAQLVDAWFEIARLETALRRSRRDVVDVPLFRPGKGVQP